MINPLRWLKKIADRLRKRARQPVTNGPSGRSQMLVLEPRVLFDAAAMLTALDQVQKAEESSTANSSQESGQAWVVVDPRVAGWQSLLQGVDPSVQTLILDPEQDGLTQLTAALSGQSTISSLHIVSHGASGSVILGAASLSADNLPDSALLLQTIGASLHDDGDILLYGCDIGAGERGRIFLQTLSGLTHADVAASSNATGASRLGGDWQLEVQTGSITAENPFPVANLSAYDSLLLLDPALHLTDEAQAVSKSDLFPTASGTITFQFKISRDPGGSGDTIALLSGLFDYTSITAGDFDVSLVADDNNPTSSWLLAGNGISFSANQVTRDEWHQLSFDYDKATAIVTVGLDSVVQGQVTGIDMDNWQFVTLGGYEPSPASTSLFGQLSGELAGVKVNSGPLVATDTPPVMGSIRNLAVDLDGVNDFIRTSLPPLFNSSMTSAFTVEFAARVDDLAGYSTFTRLFDARFNNSNDFQINVPTNGYIQAVVIDDGTHRVKSSNSALTAGTWHHFAVSWDGNTTIQFYIDGVAQTGGSLGTSAVGNTQEMRLGARTDNQGYMNGAVDELRLWNRVLTQAEINSNRSTALTGTEANLIDYWSFDEGQGTSSRDWASGGRTMTLSNMAAPANNWIANPISPWTENPSTTDKLWVLEDGQRLIQVGNASDADLPAAQWNTLQYRITDLPDYGKLYQYNAGVKGALIAEWDLLTDSSGRMFWEPDLNYYGTDSFKVKAWDGTFNSLDEEILNLTVDTLNDAPVNTLPVAQSVYEDATLTLSGANLLTVADVDAGNNPVKITLTVSNGLLTLSQITGLTFTSGDGTSDASMVFAGTLSNLNAALAGMIFVPNANTFGTASLTMTSNDQGSSGSGGALSDSDTLTITILPRADTPSVTNATTTENVQTNAGLSITRNAVDAAEVNYFYITGITNGRLFLNDGTTEVLNGTFLTNAQVGAKLRFTPSPGLTSAAGSSFNFTVQASTLNDGTLLSAPVTATITVNSVNDPPVHTLPVAQSVAEDVALIFSTANGNAIVMSDDASETAASVKTTLSVSKGTLSVTTLAGGTITGNNSASLTLTGPVAWINSLLQGMIYQPNSNVFGADTLQIVTNDQGNNGSGGVKSTADTLGITIVPMADTPGVTAATSNEDTQTSSGLVISRNAVDGAEVAYFKITGISGGILYQNNGSTPINNNDFITYAQANAGLRFTPSANVNGIITFTVWGSTLANDSGLGMSTTATVTITAVNDAPVNTVPAAQSLSEDAILTFNSGNGNLLSVSDVSDTAQAGATDQLSVTLAVLHGTVSATTGSGATLTANGTANVTVAGTAAQINAALDNLLYTPAANYNGNDTLTITSNDLGNSGSGGAKSDSDTVAITVNAIVDTPSATPATTNEDSQSSSGLVISRNVGDGAEVGFFKITGITGGLLYLQDGVTQLLDNDFITVAQGSAGLRFTPAANQNSTHNGPFQFTVQGSLSASDGGLGGGAGYGADYRQSG
ncbi:MAG: DUF4347 domain-containing protein [Magnetococcales bacterium]|nr:DUF4347 domain-containing protein [Magnetococcales bacterium]